MASVVLPTVETAAVAADDPVASVGAAVVFPVDAGRAAVVLAVVVLAVAVLVCMVLVSCVCITVAVCRTVVLPEEADVPSAAPEDVSAVSAGAQEASSRQAVRAAMPCRIPVLICPSLFLMQVPAFYSPRSLSSR